MNFLALRLKSHHHTWKPRSSNNPRREDSIREDARENLIHSNINPRDELMGGDKPWNYIHSRIREKNTSFFNITNVLAKHSATME